MPNAAESVKPSPSQAQAIVKHFWSSVENGFDDAGENQKLLRENPWIVFERSPKSCVQFKDEPFFPAAIHHNNRALVDFGLAAGAPLEDRDPAGRTALFCMVEATGTPWQHDKRAYVQRMIQSGARCDTVSEQGIPLWLAMGADGPSDWVDLFVSKGAPLDSMFWDGKPGLSALIERSFNTEEAKKSARALVRLGADVDFFAPHLMEQAPLVRALLPGCPHDMADLLLDHGVDLKKRDIMGRSYLHVATNAPMVQWLIRNGADLEARDRLHRTPLLSMIASQIGKSSSDHLEAAATAMVIAGADLSAHDGQTSVHTAGDLIRKNPKKFPKLISVLAAVHARFAAHRTLDELRAIAP